MWSSLQQNKPLIRATTNNKVFKMGIIEEIKKQSSKKSAGDRSGDRSNALAVPAPFIPARRPYYQSSTPVSQVTHAEPSVHEQIAGLNIDSCSILPYYTFAGKTKEILDYQRALHRLVLAKKYPILAPAIRAYDYLNEVLFKKTRPTVDILFAGELTSVRSLNRDLEMMLANCDKYVRNMSGFREEVYEEAIDNNDVMSGLKKQINAKTRECDALKAQFNAIEDPLSKKAFELDRAIERIEDERTRMYSDYIISTDTISDDVVDIRVSKELKEMFLINYITYQRMCDRVKRIERRLSRFIGPYLMMIGIQEVGNNIYEQVMAVTQFSRELHQLASMGVSDALKKLRSSITDIYDAPIQDSQNAVSQMRTENALQNQQLEERTRREVEYLRHR